MLYVVQCTLQMTLHYTHTHTQREIKLYVAHRTPDVSVHLHVAVAKPENGKQFKDTFTALSANRYDL